MTRKLTRKWQVKKRSKHSRKYKKTRRGKYIKKRRSVSRRRVLRGGVILKKEQRKDVDCFFDSLNEDSNNYIKNQKPSYYSSYDKALFCLNNLYKSLGKDLFIQMLGETYFKEKYNRTFYNENSLAKLRLIKFLSYIYDRISNGDTISQGAEHLAFVPTMYTKHSVKPMLMNLLCSLDGQCLNTTSYVSQDFNSGEGRQLLQGIHTNLTNLASSAYIDEETRNAIEDILPRINLDGKLAINPTILCSVLKI